MLAAAQAFRMMNGNGNQIDSSQAINEKGDMVFMAGTQGTKNSHELTSQDSV